MYKAETQPGYFCYSGVDILYGGYLDVPKKVAVTKKCQSMKTLNRSNVFK
jgi:hypothetical protein